MQAAPRLAVAAHPGAGAVPRHFALICRLPAASVGTVTSAAQFGFIAGPLVFALLETTDR